MNTRLSIGYAVAGAIVAASAVVATGATVGLGAKETAATPAPSRGAETAVVTNIGAPGPGPGERAQAGGASTVPLQPGEAVTRTEVVETAAGPVEYIYVDAPATRTNHDDDDDDHDEDDDDEHEEREHEREGLRRLFDGRSRR